MEKIYNPDFCTKIQYLENAKKYTASVSKASYELLEIGQEQVVLEFGCGGGYDVFEMAKLVGESGKVYGVDIDKESVDYAASLTKNSNTFFSQNTTEKIAFENNFFDRIRLERVVQHIANADNTISDLVRVLKKDGKIGVVETDWSSLCFFSEQKEIEDKIVKFITQVVSTNALIARKVGKIFVEHGLHNISNVVSPCFVNDYPTADAFIKLSETIDRAMKMGYLTEKDVKDWNEEVLFRQTNKLFVMQINFIIVVGNK
jgi:ubiquinone/menaquinone biosynthesis C-methylase UbiE